MRQLLNIFYFMAVFWKSMVNRRWSMVFLKRLNENNFYFKIPNLYYFD